MERDGYERIGFLAAAGAIALCVTAAWRSSGPHARARGPATTGVAPEEPIVDLDFAKVPCEKGTFCALFRTVPSLLTQATSLDDGTAVLWQPERAKRLLFVTKAGFASQELPEGVPPYATAGSSADDVWIGTKGGGLFHFDGIGWKPTQLDADEPVGEILLLESKELYAVAGAKLFRVRGEEITDLSKGLPAQETTIGRETASDGIHYQRPLKFAYAAFATKAGPSYAIVSSSEALEDTRVFRWNNAEWKELPVSWPTTAPGIPDVRRRVPLRFRYAPRPKTPVAFVDEITDELVFPGPGTNREVRVTKDGAVRAPSEPADAGAHADAGSNTDTMPAAHVDPRGRCVVLVDGSVHRRTKRGYERVADPIKRSDVPMLGGAVVASCTGDSALWYASGAIAHLRDGRWHQTAKNAFQSPRFVRGLEGGTPYVALNDGIAFVENGTLGAPREGVRPGHEAMGSTTFSGFIHSGVALERIEANGASIAFPPPKEEMTAVATFGKDRVWWMTNSWSAEGRAIELIESDRSGTVLTKIPPPAKDTTTLVAFAGPVLFAAGYDESAVVQRFESGKWTTTTFPATGPLRKLVGRAADDVWTFDQGSAFHFDGSQWKKLELPRDPEPGPGTDLWPIGPSRALFLSQHALYEVDPTQAEMVKVLDVALVDYSPEYASVWSDGKTDWLAGPGGILRRER